MMDNLNYKIFKSVYSERIIDDFNDLINHNLMDAIKDIKILRNNLYNFFISQKFKKNYYALASEIIQTFSLDANQVLLQKNPTPRIFRPGDHGTSFHCDYWYGHGERSITIWTPLTKLVEGNSFSIVDNNNIKLLDDLTKSKGVAIDESMLLKNSHQALIDLGESIIFNSNLIHGSPINSSSLPRISFDFRLAFKEDNTSTKDLKTYLIYDNEKKVFLDKDDRFKNLNFIKYICGGPSRSPIAQHAIIEFVAKEYGINIIAQEAEVERFGYPIFAAYLEGVFEKKGFDGIILASVSILSKEAIDKAKHSKCKVYCALENIFLN